MLLISAVGVGCMQTMERPSDWVATYSIVALDERTGEMGVAVQSKFFGVGSVVPWAQAGVGAVATQASANRSFGPEGLKKLAQGQDSEAVLQQLLSADGESNRRQVAILDASGKVAAHTGSECMEFAAHRLGKQYSVQGNLLAGPEVIAGMAAAFEEARESQKGELADWLVAALQAAEVAGGDRRGRQSAALLVVREGGGYRKGDDRYIDLRVEDHAEPVEELARLLQIHKMFFAERHVRRISPKEK